jgi:hypothetical protein
MPKKYKKKYPYASSKNSARKLSKADKNLKKVLRNSRKKW